jgi:hypothetical protein
VDARRARSGRVARRGDADDRLDLARAILLGPGSDVADAIRLKCSCIAESDHDVRGCARRCGRHRRL